MTVNSDDGPFAVLGLGLIGGSIARDLAARKRGPKAKVQASADQGGYFIQCHRNARGSVHTRGAWWE